MITNIDGSLKDIVFALNRIANALEEQNKLKGLGHYNNWGHGIDDYVSKHEIPFPSPWNGGYKPMCNSDSLSTSSSSDLTTKLVH